MGEGREQMTSSPQTCSLTPILHPISRPGDPGASAPGGIMPRNQLVFWGSQLCLGLGRGQGPWSQFAPSHLG